MRDFSMDVRMRKAALTLHFTKDAHTRVSQLPVDFTLRTFKTHTFVFRCNIANAKHSLSASPFSPFSLPLVRTLLPEDVRKCLESQDLHT